MSIADTIADTGKTGIVTTGIVLMVIGVTMAVMAAGIMAVIFAAAAEIMAVILVVAAEIMEEIVAVADEIDKDDLNMRHSKSQEGVEEIFGSLLLV